MLLSVCEDPRTHQIDGEVPEETLRAGGCAVLNRAGHLCFSAEMTSVRTRMNYVLKLLCLDLQ